MLAKELAYYRTHFREAVQKDGVICLECGAIFKSLPQHLGKHQLSSEDYKAKWGYNRTTPLERLITRRKKRRNAFAMKLWRLTPPGAHLKASKARQRLHLPFRAERRLADTEAARAKLAAGFRRAKSQVRKFETRTERPHRLEFNTNFRPSKDDRRIFSLRNKGLWPSEIASLLGIGVKVIQYRLERLKSKGFTLRPSTRPRPIPHRKMTDDKVLMLVRSGLSMREIAAKLGVAVPTVHRRIQRLQA